MKKLHRFTISFAVFAIIGSLAHPVKGEEEVAGGASVTREQGSLDAAKDACINSIRETFGDMVMLHAFNHLSGDRDTYLLGLHNLVRDGLRATTNLMDEVRDGKDPINVENGGLILLPPRHVLCDQTIATKLGQIVNMYSLDLLRKTLNVQVSSTRTPEVIRL
ncbi:uncharacterized protein [Venturia canescens]|uniref:uncharacterized protein n=1 Tax=Venturia canescens TaxID=32260 RepID=UPI001C9BCFFE|nr:uncharacterized protein LOC122412078 [Venturia canescens]